MRTEFEIKARIKAVEKMLSTAVDMHLKPEMIDKLIQEKQILQDVLGYD